MGRTAVFMSKCYPFVHETMSKNLTRGVLWFYAFLGAFSIASAFAADSTTSDTGKVHTKTYSIEQSSAEEIRNRLESLMSEDLRRFTHILVDSSKNELTVQGPLAAVQMADTCIPRMQQIKPTTTYGTLAPFDSFAKPPSGESTLPSGRVYRCAVRDVRAFETELERLFGNNPTVNFAFTDNVESRTLNVSVLAPEEIQTRFGQTLHQMGVLLPEPQNADTTSNELAETDQYQPGDFVAVSQSYQPKKMSIGFIDSTLRSALGKRYSRVSPAPAGGKQTSGAAVYDYTIQTAERTRTVRVELNYDRREIFLKGDKKLCEQLAKLLDMIDRPKAPEGMERRIITIGGKQAKHIRRFANALAMRPVPRSVPQPTDRPIPSFEQAMRSPYDTTPRYTPNSPSPVRQVAYKPQQDLAAPGGATLDQGLGGPDDFPGGMYGPMQGGYDPQGMYGLGNGFGTGFDLPQALNINVLPDLDIILFEGTTGDSKRLLEMIQNIEELMEKSKSEMKVVPLKNTDCVSMNEMLFDMYYLLFFSRKRGKVNLFPLQNPNALMVVGWGAAFDEMLELIEALDTPVTQPGSCWKAIRLSHVSATYASTLVEKMYPPPQPTPPSPTGEHVYGRAWMPRLRTVVDIRTNSLIVHAGPNDLKEIEQFLKKIDLHESGPQMRIQQYKLQNSVAADVAAKLTTILSPGASGIGVTADQKFPSFSVEVLDDGERRLIESGIVSDFVITPDPQQNTLIVNAPEYALPLIGKLIEMLDSPVANAQIRMIPLTNADSDSVMLILNNLIPSQILGRQQIGPQMPGAKAAKDFVPLRFANDKRSNTLIVVGAEEDLDAVEAIVLRLDEDDTEKRTRQIYTLKNAQAEDVAKAVALWIQQKRDIIRQTPGGVSPFLQIEEAFVVVAEKETNSLLIEATPKYIDEILKIIEDFDRQPDQVVIQVLIAEVNCSNTDEFGAEFGIQDSILFNRSSFDASSNSTRTIQRTRPDGSSVTVTEPVYVPAGNGIPGFNFGDPKTQLGNNLNELSYPTTGTVAPQLLSNFNMGRVGTESGFGGMVFSASSDSVSILIRALEETKRLEVLSRPQIMAMDNQMAFILIGERVPFVSGGTTTASGVFQSNVVMEEVGLMLMVTPRISPDGKVMMDIGAEKSSVGSLADGIPIPDGSGGSVNSPKISAITAKTNVCASNNETVIIGGLLTKETQSINRRVPFLSDIPVIGRLFQYKYDNVQKKELLIIMRPRVVKHRKGEVYSEDAERIKREEAAKIHWCLNDVLKMHGSPNNDDSLRIWDPTAEQPVSGDAKPMYPTVPVPLDDLKLMTPGSAPTPAPSLDPNKSPIPDRLFDEPNVPQWKN